MPSNDQPNYIWVIEYKNRTCLTWKPYGSIIYSSKHEAMNGIKQAELVVDHVNRKFRVVKYARMKNTY